jgi:hypothetical protein
MIVVLYAPVATYRHLPSELINFFILPCLKQHKLFDLLTLCENRSIVVMGDNTQYWPVTQDALLINSKKK